MSASSQSAGVGRQGITFASAAGTTHVVDPAEADAVEQVVAAGEQLPGPEGGGLRVPPGGGDQRLQPAGFGKGVGIEQRHEFGVARRDGPVVGRREADVLRHLADHDPTGEAVVRRGLPPRGVGGAVGAGIIDDDDPRREKPLVGQAVQAPRQVRPAIVVDHDHGHRVGLAAARGPSARGPHAHGPHARGDMPGPGPPATATNGRPAASFAERIGGPASGQPIASVGSLQRMQRSSRGA